MDVSKYAALFLAESQDHLRACNRLLLDWERAPAAAEPIGGLFRAIHTIKGMAATMGYTNVADLAHRTENLLDALRAGRVAGGAPVFDLLFRAVDALQGGVAAAAGGRDDEVVVGPLGDELDRAATAGEAPSAAPETHTGSGGAGRFVRAVIRPDAMMRGARALLALRKVEAIVAVSAVQPALAHLEREDFDGRFSFRAQGDATDEAIAEAVRAAGEVVAVSFEAPAAVEVVAPVRQIRVDSTRLDALMKLVGELVVARNRLGALAALNDEPELHAVTERITRLAGDLQSEVLEARMTPVGEVFERFPRLVRDLSRELGKDVRLATEGDDIELDRAVLDEIGDPLVHLIRNAVDHGIESPEARETAGKRREGRVMVTAARERNSVAIRVRDDGRGIDRGAILARARRDGLVDEAVQSLGDDQLLRILARPGFSTAEQVSGVSGRGVGVDAAVTRLRALGGTVEVQTEPGKGTTFTLRVPFTLAIVRALLARVGPERYAVPLAFVAETVEFAAASRTTVRDAEAIVVRDRVIPTVHLRRLFQTPPAPLPAHPPAVILEIGERRAALVVDALLGQQDIVVEPFDAPRGTPAWFSGATILADGAPALILDAAALV